MHGGFGPGAGPVGYPLDGGNTSTWPGVSGNDQGMGNHYPLSASGIPSGPLDPPISSRGIPELFSSSMKYGGGGKRKRKRRGNFITQEKIIFNSINTNFSIPQLTEQKF